MPAALAIAHARLWAAASSCTVSATFGDVIEARFGPRPRRRANPVLLLGHIDTVWPLGTLKTVPSIDRPRTPLGSGTLDMKTGVAMAFTAIEMLNEARLLEREIVLLLKTDEEIGSPASRPITEARSLDLCRSLCSRARAGPGVQNGPKGHWQLAYRCERRRGPCRCRLRKGANAIRELARAIETVSGWTDLKRELTVSVGVAGGGTKSNRDSCSCLGRSGRAYRPPRRRPPHGPQVRRAQAAGPSLRSHRYRRH